MDKVEGTPAIDQSALNKAVAEALKGVLPEAVKAVVGPLVDPLTAKLGEIERNHKVLADTIEKTPTLEKLDELVAGGVKKTLEAQQATAAAASKKADVRKRVVDAELKGLTPEQLEILNLPDTDDEAALTAAAKKAATVLNAANKPADVGGAGKDGGTPPGKDGGAAPKPASNLTPGQAKLAAGIKLPA